MSLETRQENKQHPKKLTIGDCFAGIGGLSLGLEWTGGFETRWQIENDPYATKVLEKHWPNVKRYSDIRDVVRPPPVDLICGGFPCQDVSLAGRRSGLNGKRTTLWREMHRLICEVEPRWVVAENVPNSLSWLPYKSGPTRWNSSGETNKELFDLWEQVSSMPFKEAQYLLPQLLKRIGKTQCDEAMAPWIVEPNIPRVSKGVKNRVGRLRCLGNAVVPQVAQKIGEMILNFEREKL